MKTTEKSFDCIKFVREQRDRLDATLAGKTTEEVVAYFREVARTSTIRPSA